MNIVEVAVSSRLTCGSTCACRSGCPGRYPVVKVHPEPKEMFLYTKGLLTIGLLNHWRKHSRLPRRIRSRSPTPRRMPMRTPFNVKPNLASIYIEKSLPDALTAGLPMHWRMHSRLPTPRRMPMPFLRKNEEFSRGALR